MNGNQLDIFNKLSDEGKKSYIAFMMANARKEQNSISENYWAGVASSQDFTSSMLESASPNAWTDELLVTDRVTAEETIGLLDGLTVDTQKEMLTDMITKSVQRSNDLRTDTLKTIGTEKGLFTSSELEDIVNNAKSANVAPSVEQTPVAEVAPVVEEPKAEEHTPVFEMPNPELNKVESVPTMQAAEEAIGMNREFKDANESANAFIENGVTPMKPAEVTSIPTMEAANIAAGIDGRDFKSANESANAFIENEVTPMKAAEVTSIPTMEAANIAAGIDGRDFKSANESANAFIENGYTPMKPAEMTSVSTMDAANIAAGIDGRDFKSAYESANAFNELLDKQDAEMAANFVEDENGQFGIKEVVGGVEAPVTPTEANVAPTTETNEEVKEETLNNETVNAVAAEGATASNPSSSLEGSQRRIENLNSVLFPTIALGGEGKTPTGVNTTSQEETPVVEETPSRLTGEELQSAIAEKREEQMSKLSEEELQNRLGREAYALKKDGRVLTPAQTEALRRYEERQQIILGQAIKNKSEGKELTLEQKQALVSVPNIEGLSYEEYMAKKDQIWANQKTIEEATMDAVKPGPDEEIKNAEESAQIFNEQIDKGALIGETNEDIVEKDEPLASEKHLLELIALLEANNIPDDQMSDGLKNYIEEIKLKGRQKQVEAQQKAEEEEKDKTVVPVVPIVGAGTNAGAVTSSGTKDAAKEEEDDKNLVPVVVYKKAPQRILDALKKHKKAIIAGALAIILAVSLKSCGDLDKTQARALDQDEQIKVEQTMEQAPSSKIEIVDTVVPTIQQKVETPAQQQVAQQEVKEETKQEEKEQEVVQTQTGDEEVKEVPSTPSNPEPSNPEPSNPEPSNPEPSTPEPDEPTPDTPAPVVEEDVSDFSQEEGYKVIDTGNMFTAEAAEDRFEQGEAAELTRQYDENGDLKVNLGGESMHVIDASGNETITTATGDVYYKDAETNEVTFAGTSDSTKVTTGDEVVYETAIAQAQELEQQEVQEEAVAVVVDEATPVQTNTEQQGAIDMARAALEAELAAGTAVAFEGEVKQDAQSFDNLGTSQMTPEQMEAAANNIVENMANQPAEVEEMSKGL